MQYGVAGLPRLQGADLSFADLSGATLCEADLSGSTLWKANLTGARLASAKLLCANMNNAKLPCADMEGADLSGAALMNASLKRTSFTEATMTGALLDDSDLSGATMEDADLSGANLFATNLTGVMFEGATLTGAHFDYCLLAGTNFHDVYWESDDKPRIESECKVAALEKKAFVKQSKPSSKGFFMRLGHELVKSLWGEDGDDSDKEAAVDSSDEEDEDKDKDNEDAAEGGPRDLMRADGEEQPGFWAPLLPCQSCTSAVEDATQGVADGVQQSAMELTGMAAEKAAEHLAAQADNAIKRLEEMSKKLETLANKSLQPRAAALKQILDKKNFRSLLKEQNQRLPPVLTESLAMLSKTTGGKKTAEAITMFEQGLQELSSQGVSTAGPLAAKLLEGPLKKVTGYTSSELLAFLRVTRQDMARDRQELERIMDLMEKLQGNVNKTNWDDIIDSFSILRALHTSLRGERSRQIYKQIWRDEGFREHVAAGVLFQGVRAPDNPPDFVLHHVKDAVKYVKNLYPPLGILLYFCLYKTQEDVTKHDFFQVLRGV